jgi:hypothetical protein
MIVFMSVAAIFMHSIWEYFDDKYDITHVAWYFYGNNSYAIYICYYFTLKLDDFYDHKYNASDLLTSLMLARF